MFEIGDAVLNSRGQLEVTVKAKADAEIKLNTKYQYTIGARTEGINYLVQSSRFTVKATQSNLAFTVSGDTVYHKHEKGTVKINVKSPVDAEIKDIKVLNTKSTTVPSGAMKYTVNENADGSWSVNYEIIRASQLVVGRTYRLAVEITPQGNAVNKAPQVVSINLKIKR